jgi:hypothetical protein
MTMGRRRQSATTCAMMMMTSRVETLRNSLWESS